MVSSKKQPIEPLILDTPEITNLQRDLKNKNYYSFQQLVIAPTKDLFLAKIANTYPTLKNQSSDILGDVYRRVQKEILKIEVDQKVFETSKTIWFLTQIECRLALPSTENKKKNLGLSRAEFKTLCAQLKDGDETLIEKVYLSHFKKCTSYLMYNEKSNAELAHSCTMEALIEIRKDLLADRILYGNLGYYFTNRAKSKLFKHRVRKKENHLSLDGLDVEDEERTERELIQEELTVLVKEAIGKLCGECKEIIKQFYYEGQSLKEIGEKTSKSYSAIRKQTTRCRDKLRRLLGENFYQEFSSYFKE